MKYKCYIILNNITNVVEITNEEKNSITHSILTYDFYTLTEILIKYFNETIRDIIRKQLNIDFFNLSIDELEKRIIIKQQNNI